MPWGTCRAPNAGAVAKLHALCLSAVSRYKDEEQGISSAGLTKFAVDGGLISKTLPESEVVLIFSSVKLGKKTVLNYDRFQEACRKMAGKSGCTYQVRRHIRGGVFLFRCIR